MCGGGVSSILGGGLGGTKGGQGILNTLTGKSAADAANEGAMQAAAGQKQAMEYLKNLDVLPEQLKSGALGELGGLYGLKGFDTSGAISSLEGSPLYKAMMDQINQGLTLQQNQTGSSAAARGLLGSGPLAEALAREQHLAAQDKANALFGMTSQLQGLSYAPTYAPDIASLIAARGQTLGQGTAAAGQIQQQAFQGLLNAGAQAAGAFSDIRLKDNVKYIGDILGHKWFTWDWNDKAEKLGLKGKGEGVMAHLVEKYAPHAIGEKDGYMTVNYGSI